MDVFTTDTKLWPSGDPLDPPGGSTDNNIFSAPGMFYRHALQFTPSLDGQHVYEFLFWNTGRHVTAKRNVQWNFGLGGWGVWKATRWYGVPANGPNGAPPYVRADAFTLGGDEPLSNSTPVDGKLSTFAPAAAWPFNGDDHEIGTAGGAASVVAVDPFDQLQFAGWVEYEIGGDDSGIFFENDNPPLPGHGNFFDHATGGAFSVAQGASATLLATYGNSNRSTIDWKVIREVLGTPHLPINTVSDPSPEDWLRLRLLAALLKETQPGEVQGGGDFESLIKAAPGMTHEQLLRAVQSVKTTLGLGQSALNALDAQLKRR